MRLLRRRHLQNLFAGVLRTEQNILENLPELTYISDSMWGGLVSLFIAPQVLY